MPVTFGDLPKPPSEILHRDPMPRVLPESSTHPHTQAVQDFRLCVCHVFKLTMDLDKWTLLFRYSLRE